MGAGNPRLKTNSVDLPTSRFTLFLGSSARSLVGFTTLNTNSLHSSAVLSSILFGCIRLAHVNQPPRSACEERCVVSERRCSLLLDAAFTRFSADRTLSLRARLEECATLAGLGPEESEWFRHTRRSAAAQRLSHGRVFRQPDFFHRQRRFGSRLYPF